MRPDFLNRKTGECRTGECKSLGSAGLGIFFNRKTGECRTGEFKIEREMSPVKPIVDAFA